MIFGDFASEGIELHELIDRVGDGTLTFGEPVRDPRVTDGKDELLTLGDLLDGLFFVIGDRLDTEGREYALGRVPTIVDGDLSY